ncbi:Uma2 family endonuclease [Nodosilinea sp. LEGE 06152]|uniref:Uma2 family endonuclease n=1 Tax=Nodosilinea sp. LEGE 06152 TaxID=2777966 RepID=UPI00187F6466|nr:Uma2 family endonuclease [Nodosilinea sp. LEGE 06152]MBE9159366.1 Uma2 family endonuclease [Nodosilinea sp. LEGE 06152]
MVQQLPDALATVNYSDSDGQPMADNTKQFRWIVVIKENLELLFAKNPDVFVAGDLLWYPVEGDNTIRQAPDVMVAIGRPKGDRGSYRQWQEGGIAPQVVFEILSPGNRFGEMLRKLNFYERYGIEEYYIYDPDKLELTGLQRCEDSLQVIEEMNGWVSPCLQIRFHMSDAGLEIYRPDGQQFLTYIELGQQLEQERERANQERERANQERERAEQERERAEQERERAEQERERAERLAEQLRAEGFEPNL